MKWRKGILAAVAAASLVCGCAKQEGQEAAAEGAGQKQTEQAAAEDTGQKQQESQEPEEKFDESSRNTTEDITDTMPELSEIKQALVEAYPIASVKDIDIQVEEETYRAYDVFNRMYEVDIVLTMKKGTALDEQAAAALSAVDDLFDPREYVRYWLDTKTPIPASPEHPNLLVSNATALRHITNPFVRRSFYWKQIYGKEESEGEKYIPSEELLAMLKREYDEYVNAVSGQAFFLGRGIHTVGVDIPEGMYTIKWQSGDFNYIDIGIESYEFEGANDDLEHMFFKEGNKFEIGNKGKEELLFFME